MRIISDKTYKEYATVEECVAAEEEYDKKMAERKAILEKAVNQLKAKQEAIANNRKAAAEEVEKARKELITAKKKYHEVLSKFCDKYGAYHYTIKLDEDMNEPFSSLFESFWL